MPFDVTGVSGRGDLEQKGHLPKTPTLPRTPPLPPVLIAWWTEAGGASASDTLHPTPCSVLSLVSCEIDDHTAKPLAASLLLCPALEEIL